MSQTAVHWPILHPSLHDLSVACILQYQQVAPSEFTCLTSGELTPNPNATVHITIRRLLCALQKYDAIVSLTVECVGLVYISTSRNLDTLGAPKAQ